MEGRARQAACLVAGVVLACALVACRHSGGSAAPLALSTSVLASSNLDWLGVGTYGDPWPALAAGAPRARGGGEPDKSGCVVASMDDGG